MERTPEWLEDGIGLLTEHGLSDRTLDRLNDAGYLYLGDLADVTPAMILSIYGISELTCRQLVSALRRYLAAHKNAGPTQAEKVKGRPGCYAKP